MRTIEHRDQQLQQRDHENADTAQARASLIVRGRGGRIRTDDLPIPKRTRYQAAPHPVGATRRVHAVRCSPCRSGPVGSPRDFPAERVRCPRGRSSMVEPWSSKPATRVRFPSPAPHDEGPAPHGGPGLRLAQKLIWLMLSAIELRNLLIEGAMPVEARKNPKSTATIAGPPLMEPFRINMTRMTANSSTTDSEMATTAHTLVVGTPHPPWGSAGTATPPRPSIVPPTSVRVDPGDASSGEPQGRRRRRVAAPAVPHRSVTGPPHARHRAHTRTIRSADRLATGYAPHHSAMNSA